MATLDISLTSANGVKRRPKVVEFLIRMVREKPLGTLGGIIALVLLFTGTFADVLAPYGMNQTSSAIRLLAPSTQHWMGTDDLGRDVLTRVIYGARVSMMVGLFASAISLSIATLIGVVTGYLGGTLDLIVQRVVDAFISFPMLVFIMVIISITGAGLLPVIIVIGIQSGIAMSRVIRSATLSIRENTYVGAAAAIGSSNAWILWRHIIPNVMPTMLVVFATRVPQSILLEASLSFIGFGIPAPAPTWGGMLSSTGITYMTRAPWMVIFPGAALAIVVYGINMLADALRDLLDPKLTGGIGRYGLKREELIKRLRQAGRLV